MLSNNFSSFARRFPLCRKNFIVSNLYCMLWWDRSWKSELNISLLTKLSPGEKYQIWACPRLGQEEGKLSRAGLSLLPTLYNALFSQREHKPDIQHTDTAAFNLYHASAAVGITAWVMSMSSNILHSHHLPQEVMIPAFSSSQVGWEETGLSTPRTDRCATYEARFRCNQLGLFFSW